MKVLEIAVNFLKFLKDDVGEIEDCTFIQNVQEINPNFNFDIWIEMVFEKNHLQYIEDVAAGLGVPLETVFRTSIAIQKGEKSLVVNTCKVCGKKTAQIVYENNITTDMCNICMEVERSRY